MFDWDIFFSKVLKQFHRVPMSVVQQVIAAHPHSGNFGRRGAGRSGSGGGTMVRMVANLEVPQEGNGYLEEELSWVFVLQRTFKL